MISKRSAQTRVKVSSWLVFLFALPLLAQAQQAKLSSEKLTRIDAEVSNFMATTHVPGVAVAIVENGAYEWAQGFGVADLENNVPASEHTLFRLGSISKSLTATAAMELWERGSLDLDAPIQKYCPMFPRKSEPITTRELLGHLAGIRHYKSGSQDDPEIGNTHHFADPIQAGLNFFENDPLVSPPGTHFHYFHSGLHRGGMCDSRGFWRDLCRFCPQNVLAPPGWSRHRSTTASPSFLIALAFIRKPNPVRC